jgi:hypothetical protein
MKTSTPVLCSLTKIAPINAIVNVAPILGDHRSSDPMITYRQPPALQQPRIKVLMAHSDPFIAAGLLPLLRIRGRSCLSMHVSAP